MTFEIDDGILNPDGRIPPMLRKAVEVIESMPDGKFYTLQRLAAEIDCTRDSLSAYTTHPTIVPYKLILKVEGGRKCVFGNKNTIEAYKEQHGEG
jgi:hypothetical protein